MKRKKPNFIRDWFDEYTRFDKWFCRKLERIIWKRKIRNEVNDELLSKTNKDM